MPITQARMIAQMQEARAALITCTTLREQIPAICESAKARYPANRELANVLDAIVAHVRIQPIPQDRETYINEAYYRRHGRANNTTRQRQEIARRMAGIPTQEEAMAILNAKNTLRRADLPTTSQSPPNPSGIPDSFVPANPSRTGIKFPQDHEDDKELEFDELPIDNGGELVQGIVGNLPDKELKE